ncbi:D-alanine--D-serine ligase VanG [Paenibacillus sp. NPDC058071]|uniref:D-alanine--D-serine ligase VanG n=1 Tax=Paenibacillus sp. NPDC058071 TaxID=3346326 RepID=UPI0036DE04DF
MEKIKIGVVFGGRSTEYSVSLASASAVIDHLDKQKYEIVMIGITKEGHWYRYEGDPSLIRDDCWDTHESCVPAFIAPSRSRQGLIELVGDHHRYTPLDAVFPALHGKNGEDGTIQGLLELSGIPFVGCGTLSSALCMDKALAKRTVEAAGIAVPAYIAVAPGTAVTDAAAAADKLGYPLYVKPSRSGSSIGIVKAYSLQELKDGIEYALHFDNRLIIERHVDGVELGCAVLGSGEPITGEIDEITLTGEFFDFEEKYSLSTSEIRLPARVDAATAIRAKELALHIYRELNCSGFARVDLFLANDGRLLFNEVNTIPGFTAKSRYPNMMRQAGVGFPDLLDRLIGLAMEEERV